MKHGRVVWVPTTKRKVHNLGKEKPWSRDKLIDGIVYKKTNWLIKSRLMLYKRKKKNLVDTY